jgi:hypothetical protein
MLELAVFCSCSRMSGKKKTGCAVRSEEGGLQTSIGEVVNKVGTIERGMIDKISGKVAYAVESFGGFMGLAKTPIRCHAISCRLTRNCRI